MDDKYAFVDKWRPSRVRAISKGELYWTEVDILNIGDSRTAPAIREGLEQYEIKINLFLAGMADHVKKVLGGSEYARAPYLIIAAHGGERDGDISMGGELDSQLAATQDFNKTMTPDDLAKFIEVKNKVVINTACSGGVKRLADVVMKGGAEAYIADTGAPFGYTSYLFPILIFYFLTQYPDISIKEAFERAKNTDTEEFKTWQFFSKNSNGPKS